MGRSGSAAPPSRRTSRRSAPALDRQLPAACITSKQQPRPPSELSVPAASTAATPPGRRRTRWRAPRRARSSRRWSASLMCRHAVSSCSGGSARGTPAPASPAGQSTAVEPAAASLAAVDLDGGDRAAVLRDRLVQGRTIACLRGGNFSTVSDGWAIFSIECMTF